MCTKSTMSVMNKLMNKISAHNPDKVVIFVCVFVQRLPIRGQVTISAELTNSHTTSRTGQ